MEEARMLTVKQVAERLQIGQITVLRWLRSGKLEGVRLGGTRIGWRIPETELGRLLDERRGAAGIAASTADSVS